jgi:hypothetical protein
MRIKAAMIILSLSITISYLIGGLGWVSRSSWQPEANQHAYRDGRAQPPLKKVVAGVNRASINA